MRLVHLLLGLFLLTCSCARESRLNVLLVTIDTTRADRLGCYGYFEPSSPNIDALAEEGALFSQAFTTNPVTLPSHTSIMTGTYPMFHGVRDNGVYSVRDGLTTLAEVFSEDGYETAAVVGAFVLDSRFNLDQGFDTYNDKVGEGWSKDEMEMRAADAFGFAERKANLVTFEALNWLKERSSSKPFFMWLHYFDPHQPVNPPEPHHSRFSEPYAGEIGYADEQIGHVFNELKKQKLWDRTLVVVTSDHGEGLLDHGESTHSLLIFDSTMHVPLIYKVPGHPAGLRLDQLTSVVDIAPTILDLVGLDTPDDVQGRSVAQLIEGDMGRGAPAVYGESLVSYLQCGWAPMRSFRTADEKLIHGSKPRYFKVSEDPGEVYDLARQNPERVQQLTDQLAGLVKQSAASDASDALARPDDEAMAKIASLGYITGGSRGPTVSEDLTEVEGMDDPIDNLWVFELISMATENVRQGRELQGIQELEEVIAIDPDNTSALSSLAKSYALAARQPLKALEMFERVIETDPQHEEAHHYLSRIKRAMQDFEGARRHAETILEFQPYSVKAHHELSALYEAEGNAEKSQEHLKKLLEIDESNIGGLLHLALSYGRQGKHDVAEPYLKRALDIEPNNPVVLYNAGIWHLQGRDTTEAISSLSRAIVAEPSYPMALYVIGRLLYERNEIDQARAALERAKPLIREPEQLEVIENILARIEAPS